MRAALLAILALLLVCAAPAQAGEQLLTLYSPPIDSLPYVHTLTTSAQADGIRRPREPGYILGFKEMALVDSKDPDAKPLPVAKMMVHHFLYYARGRVDGGPGGCLGGAASSAGAGRSTRSGASTAPGRAELRARYGIANAHADGAAPDVVAHRDGHEPLQAAQALLRAHQGLVHDRAAHALYPARRSATAPTSPTACPTTCRAAASRARTSWTARTGRRRSAGASSARRPTTTAAASTRRCAASPAGGTLFDATGLLRRCRPPLQHDPPDPARARADRQRRLRDREGHPGRGRARCSSGRRCTTTTSCTWRRWASGCLTSCATTAWRRARRCRTDIREVNMPAHYDRTPVRYDRWCRSCSRRRGALEAPSTAQPLAVGDQFFRPGQAHREGGPEDHLAASAASSRTA